jgi:hypothetical protein
MTDIPVDDDEAHLAALLAVLARARAGGVRNGTPLQQWRARRLAALPTTGGVSACCPCGRG